MSLSWSLQIVFSLILWAHSGILYILSLRDSELSTSFLSFIPWFSNWVLIIFCWPCFICCAVVCQLKEKRTAWELWVSVFFRSCTEDYSLGNSLSVALRELLHRSRGEVGRYMFLLGKSVVKHASPLKITASHKELISQLMISVLICVWEESSWVIRLSV